MIHVQILAPDGASWFEVVSDCIGLPPSLDELTAEANGGLHSLDEFVQHHAEEIYLLVQDYPQVMGI